MIIGFVLGALSVLIVLLFVIGIACLIVSKDDTSKEGGSL